MKLEGGAEVHPTRVVPKMEKLLADAEVIPEPTPEHLRPYQQNNPTQYTQAGEVSFRQLYFAVEGAGTVAQQRARTALSALQRDAAARVTSDPLAIGQDFISMDAAEVARRFGDSPFARAVAEAALRQWSGPYESGFGLHLLRVDARSAPRVQQLEQVQARVREDFMAAAREAARERRVAEILSRYSVVRTDAH